MSLRLADVKADYPSIISLWHEYRDYLHDIDCYDCGGENISTELSELEKRYTGSEGCIFLYHEGREAIGTIALRRMDESTAEFRRLYVKPDFQGKGIGKALLMAGIEEGRRRGFTTLLLDTFKHKAGPQTLYKKLGFNECPPYNDLPVAKILFMEMQV